MYNVPAIHSLTRNIAIGKSFDEKVVEVNNFLPDKGIIDLRTTIPKTVRLADHVFIPGKGNSLARK